MAALVGCGDDEPARIEGVFGPLGSVRPDATDAQRASFERGRELAMRPFTPATGLGPHFNTSACATCHNRPLTGGSAGRYRNFLLSRQELPDGSSVDTGVNGVHPFLQSEGPARRPLDPETNRLATRNPIPFFGIGIVAEITEAAIMAHADPDDVDGDGVSGRANFDRGFVGRFGRKAQTVSIEGFIRGPLFNHLGITSDPLPDDLKDALPVPSGPGSRTSLGGLRTDGFGTTARGQAAAPDEPNEDEDGVPDPELSSDDLFDLVSFSMLLAAPQPEALGPDGERGRDRFRDMGCLSCHVEALESPRGMVPLYSDLLLHDMGPELDDGIPMGRAQGSEFRTQPLWGVVATGPWLHDGRADTLEQAILLHGGEAQAARDAFAAATAAERAELVEFLASLGGREMVSEGLVRADDVGPAKGELGGPRADLDAAGEAAFRSGRLAFDRNHGLSEGLGPRFNGDACRACHSEPAVGGAGPIGLNVVRQGIWDGAVFREPVMGTMAHRLLSASDARAPYDMESNHFEMRQPQSLFGLGLLEAIPASEIRAGADPQDLDGDGIRGVAQELPDGRIGRFGWKADVPSLDEFTRDALTMEMGLALPPQAGLTFGITADDDDVPDPEIGLEAITAITAFVRGLAAPAPRPDDPEAEARGAVVFREVGCEGCHQASWDLPGGETIRPYTDLLLHEVLPEGARGIALHEASPRAFRTAPLWGVALTAPFLHDGRAATLEEAIALHDGEAATSATAVSALDASARADLIAFLRSL
ncbi:MAG: di-heme oxidoredictase family protein [Myxococcota bacterium]